MFQEGIPNNYYEIKSFLYFLQDNHLLWIDEYEIDRLEDLIDKFEAAEDL